MSVSIREYSDEIFKRKKRKSTIHDFTIDNNKKTEKNLLILSLFSNESRHEAKKLNLFADQKEQTAPFKVGCCRR